MTFKIHSSSGMDFFLPKKLKTPDLQRLALETRYCFWWTEVIMLFLTFLGKFPRKLQRSMRL
jgi:hypothetical protein